MTSSRASMRSVAPIAAVFVVSLAFVLGLMTLLNYFKFESYLSEIAQRRIGIILDNVHSTIETALYLGLNLEDIDIAPTVLQHTMAEDRRIESISIFSAESGRVLFASSPAAIGTAMHSAWVDAQARAGAQTWKREAGGRFVTGRRLDSNLSQGVGGIVLVYSLASLDVRKEVMRNHLVWAATATFAVFSVLGVFGAVLVTRDFRRTLSGLTDAIGGTEGERSHPATLSESLRSSVDGFRQTAAQARHHLDRFEEGLPEPRAEPPLRATHQGGPVR